MKKLWFLILIFCLIACSAEDLIESNFQYSGKGIVKLAVGTYSIQSDDGYNFIPDNLEGEFKVNGLRIQFGGNVKIEEKSNLTRSIHLTSIQKIQFGTNK